MIIAARRLVVVAVLALLSPCLQLRCMGSNLAPLGKATASSVWQDSADMTPDRAIDGKLDTRWGGKARNEWFQVEWSTPQRIGAVVVRNFNEHWNRGIPFTLQVWDHKSGGGEFRDVQTVTPHTSVLVFRFDPVMTTKLRIVNCITFWEFEAYGDPEEIRQMEESMSKLTIAAAGDARGRLIGTVSRQDGAEPAQDCPVKAAGSCPSGRWSRTAKTDADGLFVIDMPLGGAGSMTLSAGDGSARAELRLDAGDIATRLTPRPASAADRLSLEGKWEFAPDPPSGFPAASPAQWKTIRVPSHWEMEGFEAESGTAVYRRSFSVPPSWKGKRTKLRSEGIYSYAEVWVNGVRAGAHDGGATPFELDVTDALKPGSENTVSVLVRDHTNSTDMDAMSYYAHFNLGGVWRSLELFCVERMHFARLAVTTSFGADYVDAEIRADVTIANEQPIQVSNADLRLTLTDPNGRAVETDGLSTRVSLRGWETKDVTLTARVKAPEQWNAELPRLYKLNADLVAGGAASASTEQHIGFRQVEVKGRTFTINGKPVKLWGSCRHDADPLLGRAITPELVRKDVELMKGANLNSVRTSHYPPHPELLNASDRAGLYVEDEAPICFFGVGYGPQAGRERDLASDLRLAPLCIGVTSELLERDRNHPSVVIWSQCNESNYGRILQLAHRFLLQSDSTRPVSAGQSANLDIATYHNPTSMTRIKDTADFTTPVLFDEAFAIFQGMGSQTHGMDLDPGIRDMWVTAHFEPLQAIRSSEHQFGTQIWAWADDAFLVPGKGIQYGRRNLGRTRMVDDLYRMPRRGIVGDPMWGIVDGWRRPRPEWWLCKKLFSPIHIDERPLPVSPTLRIPVENRNAFANLDSYVCRWQLGSRHGEVRVNVPAGQEGFVEIPLGREPGADDTILLRFHDHVDRLVDGYDLRFRDHPTAAAPSQPVPARIKEDPGNLDFASLVRMIGSDCELSFDRTSGGLNSGLAGREQVILEGPALHVMKSWAPLEPYPAGWALGEVSHGTEDGRAVLYWRGRYGDQFRGGFIVKMDTTGDVEVAYEFTYLGQEVAAREIGLAFELPPACGRLEWDRRAEWSYYPDDHIGRPQGVAMAHSSAMQTVPPGDRAFAQDDHQWGCNDFRSAKRNIYNAALTDASGAGIRVISDGTQHVRATVSPRTISLKVLDFYGGSATGMNEWDGAYGVGHVIKTGDVVKGVVRLQMVGPK